MPSAVSLHCAFFVVAPVRWDDDAADRSSAWWSDLGTEGQAAFRQEVEDLNDAWDEATLKGVAQMYIDGRPGSGKSTALNHLSLEA